MIEPPVIDEIAPVSAAVIRLLIPKDQIQVEMGPAYTELMAAVAAQGVGPAGPWFAVHHRIVPDVWDFEIGVPVTGAVADSGRVTGAEIPAARVARTTYHGGYEGLAEGWAEFDAWLAASGHTSDGSLRETYAVGPETTPDPAGWRTQLFRPLVP